MIFDSVNNLKNYKGLYENLDTAIDYILSTDLSRLDMGRTVVRGDDIYINKVNAELFDDREGTYEFHRRYLDIHIDLVGGEDILFANRDAINVTKEYENVDDYALAKGDVIARCTLDNNHFVVCMLGEPHMPCVGIKDSDSVDKIIVKVRVI